MNEIIQSIIEKITNIEEKAMMLSLINQIDELKKELKKANKDIDTHWENYLKEEARADAYIEMAKLLQGSE
jgi:hypothetical protein